MLDYVKYESGGLSFEYPGTCRTESRPNFHLVLRDQDDIQIFFQTTLIPELSEANHGEVTLAAVLQDILPRLPQLVSGEKFFSAGCSGLTARIDYEHPDLTAVIWAVVISKPDGTVLQRASLIIIVPPAVVEAREESIKRILDSFSIGSHAVTDLHISFGRIEQFEFDPQAVIGTRRLSSQTADVPLSYSGNEISTVSADELAVPDAFQPTEELPDPSRITPPHTVVPPEVLAALARPAVVEPPSPAPDPVPPSAPPQPARGNGDHAAAADPKAFTVVTLAAGNGGYVDGPLALAKFLRPNGITTDPQGNLYVADFGGHRIRRISVDGIVSTVAGSGAPGFRDEPGNLAQFNGPRGIVYVSGYLFVADLNNARIRRITLDGTVATHAGDGVEGFRDGIGKQAQFDAPRAIAADFAGNLYVADGARVRLITPNGTVSTVAGNEPGYQDGPTRDARFNILSGIALDRVGNIYVADAGNKCLRRLSRDGSVTTLKVGPGNRVNTPILHPVAVTAAIDGTLYALDGEDFSIKCVFPDGSVARIAGTGRQGHRDGPGGDGEAAAEFWMPTGLALFKNRLYVTDREQHAVRLVRIPEIGDMVVKNEPADAASEIPVERRNPVAPLIPTGRSLAAVEDIRPTKPSTAVSPPRKSSSSSVPPFVGQRVPTSRLPEEYVVTTLAGGVAGYCDGVGPQVRFNNPMGLCIDQDGTLFIADHFNHCVRGMTRDGDVLTVAGSLNNGWRDGVGQDARFKGPLCTAVGPEGEIFISDHLNACIRVMTRGGEVRTLAGSGMQRQQDGLGRSAQFEGPKGIAVDATGRVYVADGVTIRTITPDGRVTTLAGGIRGFRDGRGTQAMFGWPYALALDAEGNCYVTDAANHAIRRVTPDGEVTTVYGGGEMRQMNFPSGIALDATGVIYVSDTNNHRVLRLDPTQDRLSVVAAVICGGRRGTRMGNGVDTELDGPRGIAVGPDGEVYVADSGAHRVIKIAALKVMEAERPQSGPTGTLRLDNLSPAAQAMVISSSGIDAVAPEQPVTVGDDNFHESVSVPREIADFADRMERHGQEADGAIVQSSSEMTEQPAPSSPEGAPTRRSVAPRKVAATILGWGMELKGNNIIRTEPDGTLFLDTTYGPENSAFLYQPWEVTSAQTVVVEVRMQLIAYAGERNTTGCAVWMENDRYADALLIQPEGIRFQRVPDLFLPFDTRGAAHTYTITMRGADIRVAVDGVERLNGEGKFHERPAAKAGFEPRRWLAFGDGSGTAGSAARWEFIRYRIEGEKSAAEVDTLEPPVLEEEE